VSNRVRSAWLKPTAAVFPQQSVWWIPSTQSESIVQRSSSMPTKLHPANGPPSGEPESPVDPDSPVVPPHPTIAHQKRK